MSLTTFVRLCSLVLGLAVLGCGGGKDAASDSTGAAGVGGAAGGGGAGGAGGDPSNGVCALACPTPQACFSHIGAPFDLPSCVAACQREFRGEGWLASEVVAPYFGDLASFGPDTECKLAGVVYAWTSAGKAKYAVKDEASMTSCMTRWNTACGSASTTPESFRSGCFFSPTTSTTTRSAPRCRNVSTPGRGSARRCSSASTRSIAVGAMRGSGRSECPDRGRRRRRSRDGRLLPAGPAGLRQSSSLLFNHQTHHRGRVTTLLVQAGHDPGSTDLIAMLRA